MILMGSTMILMGPFQLGIFQEPEGCQEALRTSRGSKRNVLPNWTGLKTVPPAATSLTEVAEPTHVLQRLRRPRTASTPRASGVCALRESRIWMETLPASSPKR